MHRPLSSYISHCSLDWHSGFMHQPQTLDITSLLRSKLFCGGWIRQISAPRKLKVKSGWWWIYWGNVIMHRPDWGPAGLAQVTPRYHWTVSWCSYTMEIRVIKGHNPSKWGRNGARAVAFCRLRIYNRFQCEEWGKGRRLRSGWLKGRRHH